MQGQKRKSYLTHDEKLNKLKEYTETGRTSYSHDDKKTLQYKDGFNNFKESVIRTNRQYKKHEGMVYKRARKNRTIIENVIEKFEKDIKTMYKTHLTDCGEKDALYNSHYYNNDSDYKEDSNAEDTAEYDTSESDSGGKECNDLGGVKSNKSRERVIAEKITQRIINLQKSGKLIVTGNKLSRGMTDGRISLQN